MQTNDKMFLFSLNISEWMWFNCSFKLIDHIKSGGREFHEQMSDHQLTQLRFYSGNEHVPSYLELRVQPLRTFTEISVFRYCWQWESVWAIRKERHEASNIHLTLTGSQLSNYNCRVADAMSLHHYRNQAWIDSVYDP